ncbi:MAG: DsbA family protein [Anaerolineae bacterium]|nr:DsbA family protein [Anaerolineae bacterium]
MNEQNELNQQELKEKRSDVAPFGWFALGSLFGVMMLFSALMVSTNGALLSLLRGGTAAAGTQAELKQTVKAALQEVIDESTQRAGAANPQAAAAAPVNMQNVALRPNNTQGKADAPVTIIEYSDFQCPYCLRHHTETFPRIMQEYVTTGKVKISYKEYPALGDVSFLAAQAAECAADQNAFWGYHTALFAERAKNGRIPQTKADLIRLASTTLKIDMNAYSKCVNEDQTVGRVQADSEEGQRFGVRGTPSFVINGKLVVGAQPYSVFKTAIDEALKNTK